MIGKTSPPERTGAPETIREIILILKQGDVSKASSLACAALDRGEIHPLFLNLRASRLEQQGQDRAALADLVRAHEIDPDDPSVSNALGLAFMKIGRHFEALKAYDAALKTAPQFAPAHFNKGSACEAFGYLDNAKQCYESAIAIDSRVAEPFARLASLAVRRGDFDEAVRTGREALGREPNHAAAHQALIAADLEQDRIGSAETRVQMLLGRTDLSEYDRYLVSGLLGDLRERQGRFPEAYSAFVQGNDDYYRASRPSFDPNATALAAIHWLTDYYHDAPHIPASPTAEHGGAAAHVFLVGFPRSGTTLLEQALASHPAVVTMEEKEAFSESIRTFMGSPEDHAKLASLDDDRLQEYRSAYWRHVADYGCAVGGKTFVDKLPFHMVKLPLISALFPSARVLFAVRDPRDVVLSCLRARFRINPFMIELLRPSDAAIFYAASMKLAELYRKALPLTVYEVRHEELVGDFDKACRGVCAFTGIEWNASMRDFASRQQVRAVATPSARQLAQGLSCAGIGRWHRYADQLAPLMPILTPWVERFGYAD